jgi:hypothetical protein
MRIIFLLFGVFFYLFSGVCAASQIRGSSAFNKKESCATELIFAVTQGDITKVKEIIEDKENGCCVNLKDKYYLTPLIHAARYGYTNIVTELLKNGANPNLANKNGIATILLKN